MPRVIACDLLNKMLGKSQVDSLPNGGLKVIYHGKKKHITFNKSTLTKGILVTKLPTKNATVTSTKNHLSKRFIWHVRVPICQRQPPPLPHPTPKKGGFLEEIHHHDSSKGQLRLYSQAKFQMSRHWTFSSLSCFQLGGQFLDQSQILPVHHGNSNNPWLLRRWVSRYHTCEK